MDMKKSFEEKLIHKFPDLFPKDSYGKPTYPECGIGCPDEMQSLLKNTLKMIDIIVKADHIREAKFQFFIKIRRKIFNKIIEPSCEYMFRLFDPYEHLYWRDGKRHKWFSMSNEIALSIARKHPFRLKVSLFIRQIKGLLRPHTRYLSEPVPPVTILQIKQKFNSLRIYISGGDERINAVIAFAELLSTKIK
jgi:hypothetical protein